MRCLSLTSLAGLLALIALVSNAAATATSPYEQVNERFANSPNVDIDDDGFADPLDANNFGIPTKSAQELVAEAQERARASLNAVRAHNEALMRDANDRLAVHQSHNSQLFSRLNPSSYRSTAVASPPPTAAVEPATVAAPPPAPMVAAAAAPTYVSTPPCDDTQQTMTAAPDAELEQAPLTADSGEIVTTGNQQYERQLNSDSRYTTGIHTNEESATVELPAVKRIAARRIIESRLVYRPIYEERVIRLEMPNDLRGDVFITGGVDSARIVGDNEEPLPATAAGGQIGGWSTLNETAEQRPIDESQLLRTGARITHEPVFIDVPAVHRVPARRLIEQRLVYKPVRQQVRSHLEYPKNDAAGGNFAVKSDQIRIVDAAPADHEPREEAYFANGHLQPVNGGGAAAESFSSAAPTDAATESNSFSTPTASFANSDNAASLRPLEAGDNWVKFPAPSEVNGAESRGPQMVVKQTMNPVGSLWRGNQDFLQQQTLENYAHLNQQARENVAYLNEQTRTQVLKNLGAIPREPIAAPMAGAPAAPMAGAPAAPIVGSPATPATAGVAAPGTLPAGVVDPLGLGDIARKNQEYVANENSLNQRFINAEAAANVATAHGQLPAAEAAADAAAEAPVAAAAEEGAFKKAA